MTTAYNRIDRFLRQNLNDKDYPAYKEELDALCQAKLQRTWVGLTEEKIKELFPHRADQNWFVDAIKQADKELEKINLYAEEKNT